MSKNNLLKCFYILWGFALTLLLLYAFSPEYFKNTILLIVAIPLLWILLKILTLFFEFLGYMGKAVFFINMADMALKKLNGEDEDQYEKFKKYHTRHK